MEAEGEAETEAEPQTSPHRFPESASPFPESPESPEPSATGPAGSGEVFSEDALFPAPAPPAKTAQTGGEPPAELQGRTLADLYFAQGHYSEALEIYDELVASHPFDAELKSLRRDAEARLLPAGSAPGAGGAEPGLQRRLSRIRALKEWLSVVQAG